MTTKRVHCPACGRLMWAELSVEGLAHVRLPPRPKAMLAALIAKYPGVSPEPYLIDAIWGDDPNGGPTSTKNMISIMQGRINERIEPYGWRITGRNADGTFFGGKRLARLEEE